MSGPALICPACDRGAKLVPDSRGMLICPECQAMVAHPDATTGSGPAPDSADLLTPQSGRVARQATPLPQAELERPPFSGAFLSQYQLVRLLGQGTMGAVYLMKQLKLQRLVAVKVVKSDHLTYEETRKLMREARLLASINHPNIVGLYDVGTDGTLPYMVCEYVDGETLLHRLERQPPLSISQATRIALHILDGLKAAHKQGVVHRDLKPGNILLSMEGRPKIADFGLARSAMTQSGSLSGRIAGTPPYMSPEQCRGKAATLASDLYSVGIILFEMVTGKRPFNGPSMLDFLQQHDSAPPPLLRTLRPDAPEQLEIIISKSLEKSSDRRYANASAFRKDLLDLYRTLQPGMGAVPAAASAGEVQQRAPALNAERGLVLCARYELVKLLGQGGMGQVWLAKDRVMDGAEVAVKILPPELWRDVEAQTNLKHEAKLSQKLAHPNIVRLMTLEPGDAPVLVMEYVPGKTLAHAILRNKSNGTHFTPEEIWPVVDGIASALDHAHQKGLVHRDIKPSNVLLEIRADKSMVAKLADFGIASEVTAFRTRQTGMVPVGTLAYMAPEQVACRKLDGRADTYALAATVFQALTGEPPFTGPDISAQIQSKEVTMPPALPERVKQCLTRALAKKPDDRYATAGEFAMAFYQATSMATSPGKPVLGTQESLSYVGRATRRTRTLPGDGPGDATGRVGLPPGGSTSPAPAMPDGLNPSDPRLNGMPGQGPTPWTSVVFAIGMLLMGIAAVVYVLNGPPDGERRPPVETRPSASARPPR